jgi:hypothetical protein
VIPLSGVAESVGERVHKLPSESRRRTCVERDRFVRIPVVRVLPLLIVEQAVDLRVRFAVESTVEAIRFAVVERVVRPNRRSLPRVGLTIGRFGAR